MNFLLLNFKLIVVLTQEVQMKSLKQRQLENQKRKQQREDAERDKANGINQEPSETSKK